MIYIRLGKVRGMTVEFSRAFSALPMFKKTSFRYETILDMPYVQIIFTSGNWTPPGRAANGNETATEASETSGHSS